MDNKGLVVWVTGLVILLLCGLLTQAQEETRESQVSGTDQGDTKEDTVYPASRDPAEGESQDGDEAVSRDLVESDSKTDGAGTGSKDFVEGESKTGEGEIESRESSIGIAGTNFLEKNPNKTNADGEMVEEQSHDSKANNVWETRDKTLMPIRPHTEEIQNGPGENNDGNRDLAMRANAQEPQADMTADQQIDPIDHVCEAQVEPQYRAIVEDDNGNPVFSEEFRNIMAQNLLDSQMLQVFDSPYGRAFLEILNKFVSVFEMREMFRKGFQMLMTQPTEIYNIFTKFTTPPIILTAEEMEKYKDIIRFLSDEALVDMLKQLYTTDLLSSMCTEYLHTIPCHQIFTIMETMKEDGKSCLNYHNTKPLPTVVHFVLEYANAPVDWTLGQWSNFISTYPKAFQELDFLQDQIPKEIALELVDKIAEICDTLTKKESMMGKIKHAFHDNKQQDPGKANERRGKMKGFMEKCGGNPLEYSTKEEMILEHKPEDTRKFSNRERAQLLQNVTNYLNKPFSQYTTDEIVQYIDLLVHNKRAMMELNKQNLQNAVCIIGARKDLDMRSTRKLWRMIMKSIEKYKVLGNYDQQDISCLRHILKAIRKNGIKRIPEYALIHAVQNGVLKDVEFVCPVARYIMDLYVHGKQNQNVNSDMSDDVWNLLEETDLINFGMMHRCVKPKTWKNLNPQLMTQQVIYAISSAHEARGKPLRPLKCSSLIDRVERRSDGGGLHDLGETYLGSCLTAEKKADAIANQLKEGKEKLLQCSCEEAKQCFDSLFDVLGPFPTWELQWVDMLRGSTIWSGLDYKLTHELPLFWLQHFGREHFISEECSTYKQINNIEEVFHNAKTENEGNHNVGAETHEVSRHESPIALMYTSQEEISSALEQENDNEDDVCKKMGQVDNARVASEILQSKLEMCHDECVGNEITTEKVEKCGSLMCGMTPNHISTISMDVFVKHASWFCESCDWNNEQKSALIMKGKIAWAEATDIDICTLGSCVLDLVSSELESLPNEAVEKGDVCVKESYQKRERCEHERKKWGHYKEKDDKEQHNRGKRQYGRQTRRGNQRQSSANRAKRETDVALTCDDIVDLDFAVVTITTEEIASIPDDDLKDCLETIGEISEWSTEQTLAFLQRLKDTSVFGSPDTWSVETIASAGSLVQGMSSEEIKTLKVDLDVIETLGRYDGWTESQKKEVFERFMSYFKMGASVTSLSCSEISALGHFTCGMTTDQISDVHYMTYRNASYDIGRVTSCNEHQLIEWAKLAKQTFGDVSNWDVSTVQRVGTVIGGLMEEDIQKLTEDHIDSIQPAHVTYIPPSQLEKFSTEQLGFFSSNQAQAMTSSQIAALDQDQLTVVTNIVQRISGSSLNQGLRVAGTDLRSLSIVICMILMVVSM